LTSGNMIFLGELGIGTRIIDRNTITGNTSDDGGTALTIRADPSSGGENCIVGNRAAIAGFIGTNTIANNDNN